MSEAPSPPPAGQVEKADAEMRSMLLLAIRSHHAGISRRLAKPELESLPLDALDSIRDALDDAFAEIDALT